jgi:hypothetical protein
MISDATTASPKSRVCCPEKSDSPAITSTRNTTDRLRPIEVPAIEPSGMEGNGILMPL